MQAQAPPQAPASVVLSAGEQVFADVVVLVVVLAAPFDDGQVTAVVAFLVDGA